ncbi:MAG TPA: hypothetical protein VG895_03680 [Patescibacteria group bacterium]|nr:hypothetical protein [Patescibacteria group bacterium]
MGKQISKILILTIMITSIGAIALYIKDFQSSKVLADVSLPSSPAPIIITTSMISPDGNATLTMTQNKNIYIFSSDKLNFTKVSSGKFSIPFNTWSIDDKHVFIREDTGSIINFYLEPQDLNITQKFSEKFPTYTLQDVTGWASAIYLIVNANTGTKDVSYWFDITTNNFIPLATRFN